VISLVTVTADDWQRWRAIRREALAETPHAFSSTLAQWSGAGDTETRWRERLENVPYNLLALIGGEPAGMASGTAPDGDEVELISMWVAPHARGRGIGDALVEAVIAWGRRNRVRRVALDVMRANEPAIRLYRRHGFYVIDEAPGEARCEVRVARDIAPT
jgi:ribosomal protein S18 acetylase RimI-like enzyme